MPEENGIFIEVDGQQVAARPGMTLAAALLTAGRRTWRRTAQGAPRGLFCGMGVCFDCLVTVDGVANVRACVTPVAPEMQVETARGRS